MGYWVTSEQHPINLSFSEALHICLWNNLRREREKERIKTNIHIHPFSPIISLTYSWYSFSRCQSRYQWALSIKRVTKLYRLNHKLLHLLHSLLNVYQPLINKQVILDLILMQRSRSIIDAITHSVSSVTELIPPPSKTFNLFRFFPLQSYTKLSKRQKITDNNDSSN